MRKKMTATLSRAGIAPTTKANSRRWLGLAVLALPTLLVSLDTFVMLLAMPRIAADLNAGSTAQLWMLDIYGFMVAGLLITMGTLGDRIGRRRLLLIAAAVFGAASLLAAYAVNAEMLIAARALLGIAGAALTPSTLSLITNLFDDPRERASAIGIWASCFVAGAIIGPVVGGVLLTHFWWGSVFLLGVPAMLLLMVLGPKLLPEFRNTQAGRMDLISVALSLLTILSVVYGLKEVARGGLHNLPIAVLGAGLAFGMAFARRQNKLRDPLLDLRLFANRAFRSTLTAMLCFTMLSGGIMVFVAQHLQLVAGLTPLQSGLALVPGMAASIVAFQVTPKLARRIRPGVLLPSGLAVTVAGLLVLTGSDATSGLPLPIVGFVLCSLGGGPLVVLGTNLVVGSVPMEKAGSAAGLAQTSNELGYSLGVAVLGSIATAVYRSGMSTTDVPAATDSLTGAIAVASSMPANAASDLLQQAEHAFADGFHAAAVVAATLLAGVAIVLATALRHTPPIDPGRTDAEPPGENS